MHIAKSRITYRLLTMALDNEIRDNFSFCLTTVSIMNVKFIRKKKLLPFILIEWWNQAPRWAPFGCQEPHMTETVLLSFNGERPRMLSKHPAIWGTVSFDREQSCPKFQKSPSWATLVQLVELQQNTIRWIPTLHQEPSKRTKTKAQITFICI